MGFSQAVLALATVIQMKPIGKDGSPTAGRSYDLSAVFKVDRNQPIDSLRWKAWVTLVDGH